jgi:hypothetical protein
MTTTQRFTASFFCILVLGSGATACTSQDSSTSSSGITSSASSTASTTPAVCADITALRASADKIKTITVGQGALATLSTELTAMQSTLKQLQADASAQYSAEIDAIKTAGNTLDASIRAAQQSPSATTLAAVATDARALGDAVRSLTTAVSGVC